jgi:hypothetical protein
LRLTNKVTWQSSARSANAAEVAAAVGMKITPGRGWRAAARQRWSNRWKAALNAFDITIDGHLSAGRK